MKAADANSIAPALINITCTPHNDFAPYRRSLVVGTAIVFLATGSGRALDLQLVEGRRMKYEVTTLEHDCYLVTNLQNSIACDRTRHSRRLVGLLCGSPAPSLLQ
jgi:hypothetical protein